jgi:hypothetical protein
MNATYSKTNIENKGVEFLTIPAEAPKRFGCFFSGAMLIAFAGFIAFNKNPDVSSLTGFAMFIASAGVVTLLFTWQDGRPASHKMTRRVHIYEDSIEIPNKIIEKDEIDRFVIRNGITKDVPTNNLSIIMALNGNQSAALGNEISNSIKLDRQNKLEKICYSVEVESGGKAYILAAGMDETTAFAVLKDIGRVMNLRTTG